MPKRIHSPDKQYYSFGAIKNLIGQGKLLVDERAQKTAKKDFGWKLKEIREALLGLKLKDFHKCDPKNNNPAIFVDIYKAYNLMGENVYTHFHIDDGMLIVDSFKEI